MQEGPSWTGPSTLRQGRDRTLSAECAGVAGFYRARRPQGTPLYRLVEAFYDTVYLEALAEASPRVFLETIGRTEEGREILLVAVADEEGIRSLAQLKAATADLADPRETDVWRANHPQ